jgi:hypothetical protein
VLTTGIEDGRPCTALSRAAEEALAKAAHKSAQYRSVERTRLGQCFRGYPILTMNPIDAKAPNCVTSAAGPQERAMSARQLEKKLECKLKLAGILRTGNAAEVRGKGRTVRDVEVGVIEDVIRLGSELELGCLT